ncbi:hypothetical protein JOE57_002260 [Microlunatus panaciterrae]|uniref:Uncharacterized protein n=1 Tax=Microlunatus panaciterrae TaxID=400768 RepID=A0ABS2RN16_9ACTN|nr:hypothetical protein [Microlunatus panaciterrae]
MEAVQYGWLGALAVLGDRDLPGGRFVSDT